MQPSATRDVHVIDSQPLITPVELINEMPITPEVERAVLSGREQVRKILKELWTYHVILSLQLRESLLN